MRMVKVHSKVNYEILFWKEHEYKVMKYDRGFLEQVYNIKIDRTRPTCNCIAGKIYGRRGYLCKHIKWIKNRVLPANVRFIKPVNIEKIKKEAMSMITEMKARKKAKRIEKMKGKK